MGYNFTLFISPLQDYDTLTGSYRFQQSWLISTDGFGVHPTSSEPLSVQVDRRLTRRELSAGNTQFPTLQVRYPLTEDGQLGFRGLKATQEKDYLQRHQGPSRCSASDRKTYIAHSEARASHCRKPSASKSSPAGSPGLNEGCQPAPGHAALWRWPGWYLQLVFIPCATQVPQDSTRAIQVES